ncbi:iron complex outermembrane receptor protein [Pseudomonas putida]|jgi:iron complex outermembrane recepter protein|uniref:Ligand-gated channel n=3 Tax=Pseudomonas TaxID=286 RepID=A0A1L7NEN0_PSEPU|nr:ligand-gated channel [Pseudomonas putida H8234]EKT4450682.1 TonB-dependent receptor [Pseudomonas putida]ERT15478.1 ligand-gated channel [Pseudomonas putida SJ3]MBP2082670.1 iron complex outermembrane receptor protein [Pseudomonas sp. PvP089]MBP2091626.1 iron complex outermembrane receptor protein [Pseudomonas sp. PvP088]PMY79381.1 TonB-dependent receptor [Pseudomonas sp. FW306-2-2C-D06B]
MLHALKLPSPRLQPALLTMALGTTGLATPAAFAETTAQANDPAQLGTVIVTGNRGSEKRTVTTSPVPIDVISAKQLQQTGKPGLMEALSASVPSFTLPEKTGWDASGMARAPSLRGLNAAQVLVLVNGKRRHTSATLNISGIHAGAAPTDLDLIPISLIDHVEVLRDGAAAQYGSDAIAGVINVILKADASGTSVTNAGQGYDGKKQTVQQGLNKGFEIGDSGIVQLALDARSQNDDNKASANGYSYAEAFDKAGKSTYGGYGTPKINLLTLGYNAELPLSDDLALYSFTTYSHRKAEQGQNFRLPTITNTITTGPNGYPSGYTPTWYIEEEDVQGAFGAKGNVGEWAWDLSSTYGRNEALQGTTHNQNASLGEATPNHFESGTWVATQLTSNLDLQRSFDIGLGKPLDLSWGLEHRRDTYQVRDGDWASWANGGYCRAPGDCAASGAQVTNGISPEEATSTSRNSVASYIDVGFNPLPQWYLGSALRYEHYNRGVGATRSGKLTTRYDFTPALAVRATVSNGFRAPSLANSLFSARSTTYGVVNGVYQSINYGVLPVDSAAAKALGATALKPERSTNYSLGLTYQPAPQLSFTADAYVINVRDRITLTGTLLGDEVTQTLLDNGIDSTSGGRYFTNGANTRTKGLDLVGNFDQNLGNWGQLKWTAAFNWNQTQILSYKENVNIQGTDYSLMDRQARNFLTEVQPHTKLILGANWQRDRWTSNLTLTRYGSWREVNSATDRSLDREYKARWITDIDVGYQLSKDLNLAVGAQNLFDVYPERQNPSSKTMTKGYGAYSPYGFTGGYYFTRLTYNF